MATVPVNEGVWRKSGAKTSRRTWLRATAALAVGAVGAWWLYGGEPVAETGAVGDAVRHTAATQAAVEGTAAVAEFRRMLAEAKARLESVHTMQAVFQKQERVGDKLQPLNVMDLKVRRAPMSVYMQWRTPDAGQQIIWRDGAHDGKILVSPAGWKRKIMPLAKIDPHGDMAMAVSRRPVMNIGIWNFTDRITALVDEELTKDPAVQVRRIEGDEISGRPCDKFVFEHPVPSSLTPFRQVTIYFDKVLGVPVACEHHRWTEGGAAGASHLEESYLFRDLTFNVPLTDADFDHQNPSLKFGVK